MTVDNQTRIAVRQILRITLIGALAGAVFGYFSATAAAAGAGSYGLERGALSGGIIASILNSLEGFAPIGGAIRRAPFLLHLGLKSVVYLIVFLLGLAAGQWLVPNPAVAGVQIGLGDILFCFAVSLVVNFLLDVNSLLGQNILLSFVTGRYFRPRVEQRIFLFIDMKDSTAAAEHLGEVDFHRLLNRFVSDLTGSIVVQKGQIHKYVGDELIATWPLAEGLRDARCLRACFGSNLNCSRFGRARLEVRSGLPGLATY